MQKEWNCRICYFGSIYEALIYCFISFRRRLAVCSVTWLEMVWHVGLSSGCRLPARHARFVTGSTIWIILLYYRKLSTKAAGQYNLYCIFIVIARENNIIRIDRFQCLLFRRGTHMSELKRKVIWDNIIAFIVENLIFFCSLANRVSVWNDRNIRYTKYAYRTHI